MGYSADQYRIAITVFDDQDALWNAILELLQAGLRKEQLCFAARHGALSTCDVHRPLPGCDLAQIEALERSTTPIKCKTDDVTVVRGGAPLLEFVAATEEVAGSPIRSTSLTRGLWPELLGHIRNGAMVLVVRSMSPAQQAASTRMLLRNSSQRVHTYEFRSALGGCGQMCN